MAKKILAILLSCSLLFSGCGNAASTDVSVENDKTIENTEDAESHEASTEIEEIQTTTAKSPAEETADDVTDKAVEFDELSDSQLLQYIEDSVYTGLVDTFDSEDYIIENVSAIYISKEYLDEVAYNSKANIWFGYTLEELEQQFDGQPFVFTLGDNGETNVEPFEDYDDTYDKIIKNVAIGTGVILVCVTVSIVSGGLGAAPVSMIFAASAKTGTAMALSSGAFSGVVAGTIEGIKTEDMNKAIKAGSLAASDSFKWGAIAGALVGGVSEANALRNASKAVAATEETMEGLAEWQKAEIRALKQYGGTDQVSYLAGKEVPFGTQGATRPDIVREVGTFNKHLEAIEVKYYNLESSASRQTLYKELEREVSSRVANMPKGTTQRVVLDVTDRGFSTETIEYVVEQITIRLKDIYPNIPIDVVGL